MGMRRWLLEDRINARLFQARVNPDNSVTPKKWRTWFYQRWFESGHALPWIYTPQECVSYWTVADGQEASVMNRPEEYALSPVGIMAYLEKMFSPWVDKDDSICELGCNAGGKLNWLLQNEYRNLAGIELNPACKPVMEKLFPELARSMDLHIGAFSKLLPALPQAKYAFVYTLSSIELIHPQQDFVFQDIARICGKYLMTVEIEWAGGQYFFPRNYRRVFAKHGLQQIWSTMLIKDNCPEPELCCYWGHVVRLFKKKNNCL